MPIKFIVTGAGQRDLALLESALAQPEASFAGEWLHRDHYEMAAAYAITCGKIILSLMATNEPRLQPRWCFSNSMASRFWIREAG
jgi:hypothetical protein